MLRSIEEINIWMIHKLLIEKHDSSVKIKDWLFETEIERQRERPLKIFFLLVLSFNPGRRFIFWAGIHLKFPWIACSKISSLSNRNTQGPVKHEKDSTFIWMLKIAVEMFPLSHKGFFSLHYHLSHTCGITSAAGFEIHTQKQFVFRV